MTLTALIVDDNYYNRDLFKLALEHADFEVTEAENGQEALNNLAHATYSIMLLDLEMPVMDGTTVLNKVSTMSEHDAMKVVIVTANPHMTTFENDRADYVLFKPVDIQMFGSLLSRLVGVEQA